MAQQQPIQQRVVAMAWSLAATAAVLSLYAKQRLNQKRRKHNTLDAIGDQAYIRVLKCNNDGGGCTQTS